MKSILSYWYLILLFTTCFCVFPSCSKKIGQDAKKHSVATRQQYDSITTLKPQKTIVVIQPFKGISSNLIKTLSDRLKPIVPEVRLNEAIELPESSLYAGANHYRADSLIRFLWSKSTYSSVVLGITQSPISRTANGYDDYEIIGLAFRPGHSCVVSTSLIHCENIEDRLFKSCIHELAHTYGLEHCKRKSDCYMRGAKNGVYPIDELSDFCSYCKTYLKQEGWYLR